MARLHSAAAVGEMRWGTIFEASQFTQVIHKKTLHLDYEAVRCAAGFPLPVSYSCTSTSQIAEQWISQNRSYVPDGSESMILPWRRGLRFEKPAAKPWSGVCETLADLVANCGGLILPAHLLGFES